MIMKGDVMSKWRVKISGFLFFASVVCLMATSASADKLTDFRKPNELETAYIGVAAQLAESSLCDKISDKALYLGRKPMLARSRCYYYLTLNTGELNWCRDVREVPVELGLINWLDEKRCLFQVQHSKSGHLQKVKFDYATMMHTMGYSAQGVPDQFKRSDRVDWVSYFKYMASQSNPEVSKQFYERLQDVPDFNVVSRSQDKTLYYTPEQEMREYSWTMGRGLKLCVQGRGSTNCTPEMYAKMRQQLATAHRRSNPDRMKNIPNDSLVGKKMNQETQGNKRSELRRPVELEKAYYDFALSMRDPEFCGKISQDAVAVGWTTEPGLIFMPLRSICFSATATVLKEPTICEKVTPLKRDDLDGADLTSEFCRRIVAGKSRSPHRRTLLPDWGTSLREIGFTEKELSGIKGKLPVSKSDWSGLAAEIMDSEDPLHNRLVAKLAQAPDFNGNGASVNESLFYSEADLQMHLYQLTLVRFHCSVRGEVISASAESPKPPELMTPAGNFSLTNHRGEFVTDKTYRGRYMLVYFGFTGCSHACPMSLNAMASAINDLDGTMADQIQPLFISLDPRNDTVDHLSKYVKMFHPRLQGLTGTEAEVRRAARGYSAFYYAGEVDGTYVVNHTGYIYLVDSKGRHIAHFEPGENPEKIAAALKEHIALTRSTE